MRHFLHSRTVLNLRDFFHHKVSKLALAAVGLCFLSFAKPTEARVVFTHTSVTLIGTGHIELDLNHDGINDFTIDQSTQQVDHCFFGGSGFQGLITITPGKNAGVVAFMRSGWYASVLDEGIRIDSGQTFDQSKTTMLDLYTCPDGGHQRGDWFYVSGKYLGLTGSTRYGWAQLSVSESCLRGTCALKTTLSGFAYETIRGRAIKTGQTQDDLEANHESSDPDDAGSGASTTHPTPATMHPASVGLPALAAEHVPLGRRKESMNTTE